MEGKRDGPTMLATLLCCDVVERARLQPTGEIRDEELKEELKCCPVDLKCFSMSWLEKMQIAAFFKR